MMRGLLWKTTFVSKSWVGHHGLAEGLLRALLSLQKGLAGLAHVIPIAAWEGCSGRESERIQSGWKGRWSHWREEIQPGNFIIKGCEVSRPRRVSVVELPAGRCVAASVSALSSSSGLLTPRSKQGVREGCCQLRTVLMKLSSAWFLPWVDISSAVTSHVSVFGRSVLWDSPASTAYRVFSLRVSIFSFVNRDAEPSICRDLQGWRQCGCLPPATILGTQQILSKWYLIGCYNY